MTWLIEHWQPIAAGLGMGLVGCLVLWDKTTF
jgi:hypothetical protein